MNFCEKCNKIRNEKAQFCEKCGDALVQNNSDVFQCDKCLKLFIDSKFCPNDGAALVVYKRVLSDDEVELRTVENYTLQVASEPQKLKKSAFKNCAPPFQGKDDNDLLDYLYNHVLSDVDNFIEKNESKLSRVTLETLFFISEYPPMKNIYDSRDKFQNSWIEIGKTNPAFTKSGGFESTSDNMNRG